VPERPALEAVLFDAGGTLVRLDFEWMAGIVRDHGVPMDAQRMRRGEMAGRRAFDSSRGHPGAAGGPLSPLGNVGDVRAYFGGTLSGAGVPPEAIEPVLEVFFARQVERGLWTRPMEGARATLDRLRRRGLRLAVISNSDGRAETHLRDSGVLDGLEFVVDSHRVGIEKPDPGIFRVALERMELAAERALYVGDIRSVDAEGARAAGVHFVLIDPAGDYAGPGMHAIRGIAGLPTWLEEHFDLSGVGPAAAGPAPGLHPRGEPR